MIYIAIMGPQGSGKGTQARLLSKSCGFDYLEVGELFREKAREDSEEGRWVKGLLGTGQLFPSKYVNNLVAERISNPTTEKGMILDGFPRKLNQLEYLDTYLTDRGDHIDVVIYLKLDEQTCISRLLSRVMSTKTGNVYNLNTNPPPEDEKPFLQTRYDETPKSIKTRLEAYQKNTEPLHRIFKDRGILEEVDASMEIEEVYEEILDRLQKRNLL